MGAYRGTNSLPAPPPLSRARSLSCDITRHQHKSSPCWHSSTDSDSDGVLCNSPLYTHIYIYIYTYRPDDKSTSFYSCKICGPGSGVLYGTIAELCLHMSQHAKGCTLMVPPASKCKPAAQQSPRVVGGSAVSVSGSRGRSASRKGSASVVVSSSSISAAEQATAAEHTTANGQKGDSRASEGANSAASADNDDGDVAMAGAEDDAAKEVENGAANDSSPPMADSGGGGPSEVSVAIISTAAAAAAAAAVAPGTRACVDAGDAYMVSTALDDAVVVTVAAAAAVAAAVPSAAAAVDLAPMERDDVIVMSHSDGTERDDLAPTINANSVVADAAPRGTASSSLFHGVTAAVPAVPLAAVSACGNEIQEEVEVEVAAKPKPTSTAGGRKRKTRTAKPSQSPKVQPTARSVAAAPVAVPVAAGAAASAPVATGLPVAGPTLAGILSSVGNVNARAAAAAAAVNNVPPPAATLLPSVPIAVPVAQPTVTQHRMYPQQMVPHPIYSHMPGQHIVAGPIGTSMHLTRL